MLVCGCSQITYIAGIVSGIIDLTQDTIEKDVTDQLSGDQDCRTGEHKDSWWCEAIFSAVESTYQPIDHFDQAKVGVDTLIDHGMLLYRH